MSQHKQLMLDSTKFLPNVVKMPCVFALCKSSYHYPYSNDSKECAVVVVFPFHTLSIDNVNIS